jgi:shikimate kinase
MSGVKLNLVLIGPMGAGKSAAGALIAHALNMGFFDFDLEISREMGMTIQEIFAIHGEEYFRNLEHELCKKAAKLQGFVIATGGGVPLNSQNMEILKQNSIICYLAANPSTLYKRLQNDQSRPLLLNMTNAGKPGKIQALLDEREPIYRQAADLIICTDNKTLKETAAEIIKSACQSGRFLL